MEHSEQHTVSALAGVQVIDFTTNISGPSATAILGDLGADIIKIERVGRGDDARGMSPKWNGESAYFLAINRNKKSLALDFTKPEGLELTRRLIGQADVVIENFRRGTLVKYGLDAKTVCGEHPRLVYCSLSAYGEVGADRSKPGYDAVLQARTGVMSITGSRADEPSRAGVSLLDAGSGMWAAIGIITALYHRLQTGRGQIVGTSLFETGAYWMNYHLTAFQGTREDPTPQGARHMAFAPYGAFPTQDDFLLIGISNDALFQKLVDAMGLSELKEDPKFIHNVNRVQHRDELEVLLKQRFERQTCQDWLTLFEQVGVPCSTIQRVSQVLHDPQLEALGLLKSIEHPTVPELRIPAIPVRLTETPAQISSAAPLLGAHSREILQGIGITDEEFCRLVEGGIVQSRDE